MGADRLRGQHAYDFVSRVCTNHRGNYRLDLLLARFSAGLAQPQSIAGLTDHDVVEIIEF